MTWGRNQYLIETYGMNSRMTVGLCSVFVLQTVPTGLSWSSWPLPVNSGTANEHLRVPFGSWRSHQLFNKLFACLETRKFIACLKEPATQIYPESVESYPHLHIYFLKIHFNIIFPYTPRFSYCLFLSGFLSETLYAILISIRQSYRHLWADCLDNEGSLTSHNPIGLQALLRG
jgi:hypothetical protein